MHAGKHQEYEKKLHDALNNRSHQQQQVASGTQQSQVIFYLNFTLHIIYLCIYVQAQTSGTTETANSANKAQSTAKSKESGSCSSNNTNSHNSGGGDRDSWPQLNSEKTDKVEKKVEGKANVVGVPNEKDKFQLQNKGKNKVKNGTAETQRRPEKKLSESSTRELCPTINGIICNQNIEAKLQNSDSTCSTNGINGKFMDTQKCTTHNSTEKSPQSTAKSKQIFY